MNPIPLGIYRHYKGKTYKVTGFAKHSETLEDMVIYEALYGEHEIWARPLSMWENPIDVDGKTVKRFEFVGDGKEPDSPQDLRGNVDKLHTTPMGAERVRKNLSLVIPDVAVWCKERIEQADRAVREGKNWYVYAGDAVITINAHSHTIITAHKSKIWVREISPPDYPALEEFQYLAIFVPPGEPLPPREIIYNPDVFLYIDGFGGKHGDCGVVAEIGDQIIGAAWTRIIPAYGHIDDATPELAISVLPDYRGHAVGSLLMTRLFGLLRSRGFARTSLAVQKRNAAVRFYQRLGYETVGENDAEFIMLKYLTV